VSVVDDDVGSTDKLGGFCTSIVSFRLILAKLNTATRQDFPKEIHELGAPRVSA